MTSHERYRREQEEFVSNHGGSSSRDVIYAILPSVCGVILTATTLGLFPKGVHRNVRALVEFTLNIVPCVLCCTLWSDHVVAVCIAMTTISMLNIFLILLRSDKDSPRIESQPATTTRRAFLTNFRALTNIITAVCVLAVDFRVFPRKFAKTEVYGYSLMDTGVGLFVVANALVAPETREFSEKPRSESIARAFARNSRMCARSCAPLLILGLGRFLAVEYSGYHKHVTEYGVHWNFFVTLAFVKMFTSTIAVVVNARHSLLAGVWILAMHEYALSTRGLKQWVLGDAPRDDFVSANREGIVSVPGYVGLYLVSVAVGRLVHSTYRNSQQRSKFQRERVAVCLRLFGREVEFEYNESMTLCVKLSLIAVQACAATLVCDNYLRVSRRLTNSGYCAWILTLSCAVLTLLLLVEITADILAHATTSSGTTEAPRTEKTKKTEAAARGAKKKHVGFKLDEPDEGTTTTITTMATIPKTPEIFEAVNYNGLAFFLLANLATGLVNMSVRTLYVGRYQAVQILVGYSAFCHLVALVLYRYRVQIKL